MAPRRNFRKFRKRGKKKTKQFARRRRLVRYGAPFPNTRRVLFKYAYFGNLTSGAGNTDSNLFRANNIYDPDQSGVGNQPRYFDQLLGSTLYQRFRVDKIGYRVTFINKTNSDALCAVRLRPNTGFATLATDLWYEKELGTSKVYTLMPNTMDGSRRTISGQMTLPKLMSVPKAKYEMENEYAGWYNAGPDLEGYLAAQVSDDPNTESTANVDIYVTLWYYTTLFDFQRDVAQS